MKARLHFPARLIGTPASIAAAARSTRPKPAETGLAGYAAAEAQLPYLPKNA